MVRAAFAVGTLGAMHSLAGATTYVQSPASPVRGTVGTPLAMAFTFTGAPSDHSISWSAVRCRRGPIMCRPRKMNCPLGDSGHHRHADAARRFHRFDPGDWSRGPKRPHFHQLRNHRDGRRRGARLTTQPVSRTAGIGGTVTFATAPTGTPFPTFQWTKNGAAILGATGESLVLTNVQPGDAVPYAVIVSNSAGSVTSSPAFLTVSTTATPLVIVTQPVPQAIANGATVVFNVVATGAIGFQWRHNGTLIANATSPTLVIKNVTTANTGEYSAVVTGSSGPVNSEPAALTVWTGTDFGRLINLSILANVSPLNPLFTLGTVIGGPGTGGSKPLLVRAAGPALAQLGVTGALPDPKLDIFSGATLASTNDDWGGTPALTTAFTQVGAFAFASPNSKDAAAFNGATAAGAYTIQVSGVGGASGSVIAELYDATPPSTVTESSPRLVNVSVLKQISDDGILTAGFVIGGGNGAGKTVLIRAIGPALGLAPFNVSGAMADPKLVLFSGQTVIASNDNWGGDPQLTFVGNSVGAFAVGNATSRDAMLVVTLAPGQLHRTGEWRGRRWVGIGGSLRSSVDTFRPLANKQSGSARRRAKSRNNEIGRRVKVCPSCGMRFWSSVLLLAVIVTTSLHAQSSVPTLLQPVPSQALAPGGAPVTIDVRNYVSLPGVSGDVVQVDTVLGRFNLELMANDAPRTVANFLNYISAGRYQNTFIHRAVTNFVIQGGGYLATVPYTHIATFGPVQNEFKLANVRGTVAMAKLGNDPNSATSEWFVNLGDNRANLDAQNGGFTVFARVIGTGMTVVDAIAALPRYKIGFDDTSPLVPASTPLRNVPATETQVRPEYYVTVTDVKSVPLFSTAGSASVLTATAQTSGTGVVNTEVSASTLTLRPVGPGTTNVTLRVVDTNGNAAQTTFAVTVAADVPAFTLQPVSQTVAIGSTVVFNAAATGGGSYRWERNGVAIAGGISGTLVLNNASAANAGTYVAVATTPQGAVSSSAATLTVSNLAATEIGRLINLSILTAAGSGAKVLTMGAFVGAGDASAALPLVIRAVGPTLAQPPFNVSGVLPDPVMTFYAAGNTAPLEANDNWGGSAALTSAFRAVGAFELPATSLDSAIARTAPGAATGGYTVQVTGKGDASGVVIAEIYDASGSAAPQRLRD